MACAQATKSLHTGRVKITHINFAILNSHIIVVFLRFIRNTYFYVVKQKLKITVLAFFKQENCYNKMISVRKSYLSKSFKKQKAITCPKCLEISWLLTKTLKESYDHLYQQTALLKIIYILDFRVEISFIPNGKPFDFNKASFTYSHIFKFSIE